MRRRKWVRSVFSGTGGWAFDIRPGDAHFQSEQITERCKMRKSDRIVMDDSGRYEILEEKIERPGTAPAEGRKLRWLNLFCPEQSCEISAPSELA